MRPIILASASPRRQELLSQVKIPFIVKVATDVELDWDGHSAPNVYAREQAHNKTQAIAKGHPTETILGADTVVVIDGQALGKPVDADDARRMLGLLSGRTHQVITAFCICHDGLVYEEQVGTSVSFLGITIDNISGYLHSNEWQGKAGAYAIQGLAGAFVSRVDGSYPNVVGLPITEVVAALCSRGLLPKFPLTLTPASLHAGEGSET